MRQSSIIKSELNANKYNELLEDIYVDHTCISYQKDRYINAIKCFEDTFSEREIELYSTPGRSEVCGNHTDHQNGLVLATSINLDTIAVVAKNNSDIIKVASYGYDMIVIDINNLEVIESEFETSKSLIRGVVKAIIDDGYNVSGFNSFITSDVLVGAGLSSSASFEVMIGTIISGIFNNMSISPEKIAKYSKFAENVYFNKPCGLMDQMACSIGGLINIDFSNENDVKIKKVNIDFEYYKYSLCIVDTKGSHVNLTTDYSDIPREMTLVANYFNKSHLCHVAKDDFYKNIPVIRKTISDRAVLRAIHFYNEQENVMHATNALTNKDFETFLKVISKSGNSSYKYLQNIYTNTDVTEQNLSIAIALSENFLQENGVVRVHGGGFAGTIQAFVKNSSVLEYKTYIETIFGDGSCHILKISKYGGIKVI